jgi:hypothetical protein
MSDFIDIYSDFKGFQQLISFYEEYSHTIMQEISLNIKGWFAANMSSVLGALLDNLANGFNQVNFANIDDGAKAILSKNNFLSYFGYEKLSDSNQTTIQYQKLKTTDSKFFNSYVYRELLNRTELPQMSNMVKERIAETICEIFVNAQIHSNTEFIYTCGQFYPSDHKIEFTITDTGIGFKKKINERFGSNLDACQAIQWAIKDKNTTKKDIPGGIGLALLQEFIMLNNGKMQIISDNGFYEYGKDSETTQLFQGKFPGTVVNLQFRTDDNHSYTLKQEN